LGIIAQRDKVTAKSRRSEANRSKLLFEVRVMQENKIFVGAITEVKTVWDYADTMNGLQIFPNLIALIVLAPQVAAATRSSFGPTTSK